MQVYWVLFKVGVNPEIFKTITVCIKVYIFGIEISQRIHFWYQILLKSTIFGEKITFLVKEILGQPKKHKFELKCWNCLKIMLRQKSRRGFLIFWTLIFWKFWPKKWFFWQKLTFRYQIFISLYFYLLIAESRRRTCACVCKDVHKEDRGWR